MPRLSDLRLLKEALQYGIQDAMSASRQRVYKLPIKMKNRPPKAEDVRLSITRDDGQSKSEAMNPIGKFYLEPGSDYVVWGGHSGIPRNSNVPLTAAQKRIRADYGLRAMHAVANALAADARKFSPKRYTFSGATDSHERLYASLQKRMRREGYAMKHKSGPYGSGFTLKRFRPTMMERYFEDLAAVAPLGGLGTAIMLGDER